MVLHTHTITPHPDMLVDCLLAAINLTAGSILYTLYYSASTHIQPTNNPKLKQATHNMLSASV